MAMAIIGMAPVTAAQGDTEAFLKRGNAEFRAGNFEQALIEYSDALAYGNDSALLFFNMGSAHYKLGEFYQAGQAFEEAAKNEELAASPCSRATGRHFHDDGPDDLRHRCQ